MVQETPAALGVAEAKTFELAIDQTRIQTIPEQL